MEYTKNIENHLKKQIEEKEKKKKKKEQKKEVKQKTKQKQHRQQALQEIAASAEAQQEQTMQTKQPAQSEQAGQTEHTEKAEKQPKKKKAKLLTGIYLSNARGFGFVRVEGMEEDLYIPIGKGKNAFYGDTVEVKLGPVQTRGARQEAEVERILERGMKTVVGTYQKSGHHGFVTPDNTKIGTDIVISQEDALQAVDGHKVVAEITDYGAKNRPPRGRITEILGHMDDPGVDILSIIRAFDLPGEFPEEVKAQLRTMNTEQITEPDMDDGRREDLRDLLMVTIDGEDAKDLDDAVSLKKHGSVWELGVHIADVSEYVTEGCPLDKEALKRATSVYLVDRVIPMLPHELSNGICSLNQGEDRYALSCLMTVDAKGKVIDHRIVESLIRTDARLSYTGVQKLLKEKDTGEIEEMLRRQGLRGTKTKTEKIARMLRNMERLAKVLHQKRQERGSIDFDFPESKIILDHDGHPVDIHPYEHNDATNLIEDFMLLANETVAEHCSWMEMPFVYRTHGAPDPDKIKQLAEFVRKYHVSFKCANGEVHPKEIQQLLTKIKGTAQEDMLSRMALRSMQQARYTTACEGHFGLALQYYCHFTSPIRRYPDLQIHRIIKKSLRGELTEKESARLRELLPGVAKQSSDMERRATEAERETQKQKKCEYMQERVGESFTGRISGVTGWGLYVELPNTVEGLIHVSNLRDDYYAFDEKQYILVGERTGHTYSLGQTVDVTVTGTDLLARTIDFSLKEDAAANAPKEKGAEAGTKPGKAKQGKRKKAEKTEKKEKPEKKTKKRKSGKKKSLKRSEDKEAEHKTADTAEKKKPTGKKAHRRKNERKRTNEAGDEQ